MEFTKKELEEIKKDPLMNFFANLLGTNIEEIVKVVEKEEMSSTRKVEEAKAEPVNEAEDPDEIRDHIKSFFDKMVERGEATVKVEDGRPHYSIKLDENCEGASKPEELIEENENTSFSMSKEELKEFVKDYTRLDETVRKLEHTYGIDLNANGNSIYAQYNTIIWNLIEKIFGEDNREDIADFIFGDSNFDSVETLYDELV